MSTSANGGEEDLDEMRIPLGLTAVAAAGGLVAGALFVWTAAASGPAAPVPAASSGHSTRSATAARHRKAARPVASATPATPPLVVTGAPQDMQLRAGAVEDAATGTLLWSQGLNTELPMGSITKVMTALLVIDSGDLNREITVPQGVIAYVNQYGAASAGLQPGDVLTAQELLEALLLPSGCDAAYTLAMTYGPGMPAFLAKMNAMARQLGMMHTSFTSPDGLPYPTEYSTFSTPADLITLGRAAMASPVFREIVAQQSYTLPAGPGHRAYSWQNDDALIGSYPGADGIKTGYTLAAGQCLLFEASRDGLSLIGVVLGAPATGPSSSADAAAQMLNWGFSLKRT
jgi:serine-type D-Ala-D-Ala carboxypeptidase (penicillin-binding protein 5/6)